MLLLLLQVVLTAVADPTVLKVLRDALLSCQVAGVTVVGLRTRGSMRLSLACEALLCQQSYGCRLGSIQPRHGSAMLTDCMSLVAAELQHVRQR